MSKTRRKPAVEIAFEIETDEGIELERLWARPVGPDRYRLENTPIFAYGASYRDVVEAELADDATPVVRRMLEKSGHRTLRLLFEEEIDPSKATPELLDRLAERGCCWEGFSGRLVAIDIPAAIDFDGVVDLLQQSDVDWEHADPTHEELYGED
ncbi:MAG: DUF4265 domain-containing protein [Acidobacteriota bacterium]